MQRLDARQIAGDVPNISHRRQHRDDDQDDGDQSAIETRPSPARSRRRIVEVIGRFAPTRTVATIVFALRLFVRRFVGMLETSGGLRHRPAGMSLGLFLVIRFRCRFADRLGRHFDGQFQRRRSARHIPQAAARIPRLAPRRAVRLARRVLRRELRLRRQLVLRRLERRNRRLAAGLKGRTGRGGTPPSVVGGSSEMPLMGCDYDRAIPFRHCVPCAAFCSAAPEAPK